MALSRTQWGTLGLHFGYVMLGIAKWVYVLLMSDEVNCKIIHGLGGTIGVVEVP